MIEPTPARPSGTAFVRNRADAFDALLGIMPAGVIALDGEGRIKGISRSGLALLGAGDGEAILGRDFMDLVLPAHRAKVRTLFEKGSSDQPCPVEFGHTEGGAVERREFSGRLIPVGGGPGSEREWLVLLPDLAEPRRLEAELRQSEARLRQIIDLVPHYIFAKNAEGEFILVNQAIANAYGTTVEDLLGKTDADFNPNPDEVRHFLEDDHRVIRSGQPKFIPEEKITEADGKIRFLQTTKIPYLLSGTTDRAILGVAVDITGRKRAEEEAVQLEAELQVSRRLESLGVLAGGIAHDFNNLLVGILGNTRIALQELPADSTIRSRLEGVITSSKRAAELCSQMLAYSGNGRLTTEEIDMPSLVEEIAGLLRVHASPNTEFRVIPYREPARVEGDPIQIRQVIMNLAMNGMEAVKERGGGVTLETGVMDCSSEFLESIPLRGDIPAGPCVFVDVRDNGCGMDEDVRTRMFDPFFTTKFTGRGLGLSAVLGIVRAHDGAMIVRSAPKQGTAIRVLLPATTKEARRAPAEEVGPASSRSPGKSILVVDDEPTVRFLTRSVLEHAGYEVRTVESGAEAVDMYRRDGDGIGAVLLDMTMPGMDGSAVLEKLKNIDEDVRVVLTSGYIGDDAVRDVVREGAVAFLAKPFEPRDLLEKLRRIMRQSEGDA